ncbi:MAG TPA: hypothetical protein VN366_00210, partial [Feifaniaceae bacterium]|nr:hypothetical protein [Feifaniaceae bacterium]
ERPDLQVRAVRQALSFQESLEPLARYLAKNIRERQDGAPPSPADELRLLSRSIKTNILALLRSREWVQAKALLDSLKSITPDDPELKFLYAKLPDGI